MVSARLGLESRYCALVFMDSSLFKVNLGQLKVNPGLTWGNTTMRGLTALWANQPPGAAVSVK